MRFWRFHHKVNQKAFACKRSFHHFWIPNSYRLVDMLLHHA